MLNRVGFAATMWIVSQSAVALACGGAFGKNVQVAPQQEVLVVHKQGVESYVFQPVFCGDTKDFGLILPVPAQLSSPPALVEASLFTRLGEITAPRIERVEQCESRDAGAPSRGVGGSVDGGAAVVAQGRVGFLDWAQLKADSPASFISWLDANGYPHGADTAVFDYYVAKGWYFTAFKVNDEAASSGGCKAFGPVQLAFPSAQPVLPSRIASVAQSAQTQGRWRVFGLTAASEELRADDSDRDSVVEPGYSGGLDEKAAASLFGLAAAGDRLTRWAVSQPGRPSGDIVLSLAAPADYQAVEVQRVTVKCGQDAAAPDKPAPDAAPAPSATPADAGPGRPGDARDGGVDQEDDVAGPRAEADDSDGCSVGDPGAPSGRAGALAAAWLILGLALSSRRRARARSRD